MSHRIKARLFGSRRRKIATSVATVMLVGGGVALAAWLVQSVGRGSPTTVGSLSQPVVTAGAAIPGEYLLPGAAADVRFSVNNANSGSLVLTKVEDAGSGFSSFESGCPASSAMGRTLTGLSIPIQPGANTVTVPDAIELKSDAPNDCQTRELSRDYLLSFSTP
jgi:hypothetical protein